MSSLGLLSTYQGTMVRFTSIEHRKKKLEKQFAESRIGDPTCDRPEGRMTIASDKRIREAGLHNEVPGGS